MKGKLVCSEEIIDLPPAFLELVDRRTRGFLDRIGLDKPITHLLKEAYIQGMKDAVDIMTNQRE